MQIKTTIVSTFSENLLLIGERLVQSFPMRYFYRYEVEHLLTLSGFRIVDLFGDFDRSAFSTDSPEMIFIAEKK